MTPPAGPDPAFADGTSFERWRDEIAANLTMVRQRIDAACARVGRNPAEVRLLPVSKTVPPERLRAAFAAGCAEFGENLVQEALAKCRALADLAVRWAMIGHLQTNKAKQVARFAHEFQALDSLHVAETLERRLEIEDRRLDVLVQVNTSGEASKFGLEPAVVPDFARSLAAYSRLRPRGLMTIALDSPDRGAVRACFRRLRELRERLHREIPDGESFHELSMGMSGDFELAIEEGATVVRIGTAIFGARPDGG